MTRPTRKIPAGELGAYQDGETVDLDKLVVAAGNELLTYDPDPVFDFQDGPMQEMALTGDIDSGATLNRVVGASLEVFFDAGGSTRNIDFSGNTWVWIGPEPTALAANKLGVLRLTCRDAYDESGIVAEWGAQE